MARRVLPGFGLTIGLALFYVSTLVLIPLAGLFLKATELTAAQFWQIVTAPRALAAYQLSLGASALAAIVNGIFGPILAWVLVRYPFPGRRLVDAMVDLPFAMPTAVAGIALTTLYSSNGWLGRYLEGAGVNVAFTWIGIVVALTFVGLPFVIRVMQPVLEDLPAELEEAAATLGATRFTTLRRVVTPYLLPAWLTGVTLAFARGVGEYGSVVFISGNLPLKTEIVPLLIMTKLEQFDYPGAAAIAVVMLVFSLALVLAINLLQGWSERLAAAQR
jgi:sulfate/thiosulfate transport system permease protein